MRMGLKEDIKALNSGGFNIKVGGFTLNLPSLNVTSKAIETPGIGGNITSLGSAVQILTAGARGVLCIGSLLSNPSELLKTLNLCKDFVVALGLQFVNDLYKTCIARINNILSSVYGLTLSYFRTSKNVLGAINNLGSLVEDIIKFWEDRKNDKLKDFLKKEDCTFFVANILRCMIGKFINPILEEYKLKGNQAINDIGADFNNKIFSETEILNNVSSYLDQQSMFVNKFTNQVKEIL